MVDIVVKASPINDLGGFAGRAFKKGECIGEYTGPIVTDEEAAQRYEGVEKTYLFTLEDGTCIDAMHADCPLKYLNHSCEPNCVSRQRGKKIFYFATRDIKQGEELTVDYNLQVDESDEDPYTCLCRAPNCRGTMKEAA